MLFRLLELKFMWWRLVIDYPHKSRQLLQPSIRNQMNGYELTFRLTSMCYLDFTALEFVTIFLMIILGPITNTSCKTNTYMYLLLLQSRGAHNQSLKISMLEIQQRHPNSSLERFCAKSGKYKAMHLFPMQEDRNKEDCNSFGNYSFNSNYYEFFKPKFGMNILPMSKVCRNHFF